MRRNWIIAGVLVLLLALAASIAGVSSKSTSSKGFTPRTFTVKSSGVLKGARTGDVVQSPQGAGVTVPAVGTGRCAIVERGGPGARAETLCVSHTKVGKIVVRSESEGSSRAEQRVHDARRINGRDVCIVDQNAAFKCFVPVIGARTDNAFTFMYPAPATPTQPRVTLPSGTFGKLSWKASYAGKPSYLTDANLLSAYQLSISNWTNPKPDSDKIVVSAAKPRLQNSYLGTTTLRPNVSLSSDACVVPDKTNVVGWSNLGGIATDGTFIVGQTCLNITGTQITESDIALNNNVAIGWQLPSGLNGGRAGAPFYNVEAVLTHERGHQLGLAHPRMSLKSSVPSVPTTCLGGFYVMSDCIDVPELHPDLTMGYNNAMNGDFRTASLGKGDISGITALYGAL